MKLLKSTLNQVLGCIFLALPSVVLGGVCDVSWDGDKLAALGEGKPDSLPLRLNDKNGNALREVTVGQIGAIRGAKEGISKATGRAPILLICDSTVPNAFAFKGRDGDVVAVTVGIMKIIDTDRDMAAAVIGHEYAHHIKGHGASGKTRNDLFGLLGIIVGAALDAKIQSKYGVTGLGKDLGQLGASLTSRKFDRDQEREADEDGFNYLVHAGFDPNGAVRLANKFSQMGLGSAGLFLDSHPGWEERSERFQLMIAKNVEAQRLAAKGRPSDSTIRSVGTTKSNATSAIALLPTYTATDSQAAFTNGVLAWRNKNYEVAVRDFRSSAEAGYAPAQLTVGYMYLNGIGGVVRDDVQAARMYRLSADQGYAPSQSNLGVMYMSGRGVSKDDAEAVRLFKLAADQNDAGGQSNLGLMYEYGRGGLVKNEAEAVRFYRLSADQGNPQGQTNLGIQYRSGRGGLPVDEVEAVRLFKLASDTGYPSGQVNLGLMYAKGRGGLPKDELEAAKLFRLAADQGHPVAKNNLAYYYEKGIGGLAPNLEQAVALYREAASTGNPDATANLKRLGRM